MPQIIHSFRGENRNPRLKIPKGERAILENAAGLCEAISNATVGHNAEVAAQAHQAHLQVMKFVEMKEAYDLSQPF